MAKRSGCDSQVGNNTYEYGGKGNNIQWDASVVFQVRMYNELR